MNHFPTYIRSVVAALAVVGMVALAGCGYTVGRSFDVPVQTVAVPTFGNESFRRGLEFQLTEQVQREIQNRTTFRVVRDDLAADTRLVGQIVRADKRSLTQSPFGDPRQLEFQMAVQVEWQDVRTGRNIAEYQIPVPAGAIALLTAQDFAPETGQSRATAEREAVANMARQIVDLMETPW